jgi:hypothetical protein
VLNPKTFDIPFQHHSLSAVFYTPFGPVEGHTVHVMPGSMVDEDKVEMFEGIYDRLAVEDPPNYRFCAETSTHPNRGVRPVRSRSGVVTIAGSMRNGASSWI